MTRKLALILLFVVLAAAPRPLAAYPSKDTLNFSQVIWGWDDTAKKTAPVSVNATSGAALVEVSGGISISVGSTTFTAAPVFADAGGTGTVALVDADRRIVANLGSDTIGLVTAVDAVTTAVSALAAQLATETDTVAAAIASVEAELASPLQVEATLSTDSISLVSTIAAISTDLLAAFATQTLILEGAPGVTVATLPDVDLTVPSTSSQSVVLLDGTDAVVTALANRRTITLTATGTFEYAIGAATVPANTTPCYSASFEAGPDVAIAVKTSATGTYLTIRQLGE